MREIHSITVHGVVEPSDAEEISAVVDEVLCGWCGDGAAVDELGQTGAI